jgi:hypothetical protein
MEAKKTADLGGSPSSTPFTAGPAGSGGVPRVVAGVLGIPLGEVMVVTEEVNRSLWFC